MSQPAAGSVYHRRTTCRACGGTDLGEFLALGPTPLANAFLQREEEFADESVFPLDVFLCKGCSLVQLLDVVDPEVLFGSYVYVTGTSDTMAQHNTEYAEQVVNTLDAQAGDLIIEVASNDGSLLSRFQPFGMRTLGVEPASNIAAIAREAGVPTVEEFFGLEVAAAVRRESGAATAVIANNVLAHVDDPRDFLSGCRELLADDGRVIVEVPYLRDLLERLEYDTIYHEHLCYFSVTALMYLFSAAGLSIDRVQRIPVHGGSLRVYASRAEQRTDHAPEALKMADEETVRGLTRFSRFERFAREVEANREELLALLGRLRDEGHQLAAYGAPAKGNTLLNYCGIGTELLPYTVDKNPLKVGSFTPGMHLPVRPVSALVEDRPDFTLILAWNFATEIVYQESLYRAGGGRFLLPIPKPRVHDG
jgi:SAM-dependent methyltransferase